MLFQLPNTAAMANEHDSDGLSTHGLQTLGPVQLRGGDAIISVEQGRCVATDSETHGSSNTGGSLYAGRILAPWSKIVVWGCKMNPLKVFQSDEAMIKDGRFNGFIMRKR